MKWLGCFVLVAMLACGCVHTNPNSQSKPAPEGPPSAPILPRPVPRVTADQVNEGNAPATCDALWEEMDREEQGLGALGTPAGKNRQ
jgi:hypothetical protein